VTENLRPKPLTTADGDVRELDQDFFARAKRGRSGGHHPRGGDKSSQSEDIARAKQMAKEVEKSETLAKRTIL
jgi:hypothetical protein